MPQITTGVSRTDITPAGGIDRTVLLTVPSSFDLHLALAGQSCSVSSEPGLHHTIKLVHAKAHSLN
jgi:hypothetical protein